METQPTSGFPLWVWEVEPGSMRDITAARIHAHTRAAPGRRHRAARPRRPRL